MVYGMVMVWSGSGMDGNGWNGEGMERQALSVSKLGNRRKGSTTDGGGGEREGKKSGTLAVWSGYCAVSW